MLATRGSFSVSFVTGSPGSGKSYTMTRDVIERLCEDGFSGKIITNLPLNIELISEYVAKKKGCDPLDIAARICPIPQAMLAHWKIGLSGPWDYYEGDKEACTEHDFILDECHLFCPKEFRERMPRWTSWLGEVRHEKWARVIFLTQDISKVGLPIIVHTELKYELTNAERLRDPLLKLPLLYWYELRASFTGVYQASIARAESRRIDGKLKPTGVVDTIQLDPYWFKFYSSFEAAGGGSSGGGSSSPGSPKKEFELRPRFLPEKKENGKLLWPTWIWFLGRAPGRLFGVVFGTFFFFWFMFLGGSSIAMESFLGSFSAMAEAQQTEAKQEQTPLKKTAADSLVDSIKSIENIETKDAITSEIYKLSEAIHEMEEENRELKELAEKATAEVEQYKIEKDVRDEMVTGIFGSHVVLASGQRVKLGQKIRFGPLAGRKVVSIDKENRLVDFGDDVFGSLGKPVWMRHDPGKIEIQGTSPTTKRPATIPKELPEIRKNSPEKTEKKSSEASIDQHRGHEH